MKKTYEVIFDVPVSATRRIVVAESEAEALQLARQDRYTCQYRWTEHQRPQWADYYHASVRELPEA